MALRRLTIYLLRNVNEFADAVDSTVAVEAEPADAWKDTARFFSGTSSRQSPEWLSFVAPTLKGRPVNLGTSSASGLLVVKAAERFFALTFGYGRSFLDQSRVVRQFGLRVALNSIDPAQMRSVDTKTFEDMVVSRNTQTSKRADLPSFNIDISRDILRAVVGEPRDSTLAKRIAGSDALVINRELGVADLPGYCERLVALHEAKTYQDDFAWVDHLALVEDSTLSELLDTLLVEQIRVGDTSSTHMALPPGQKGEAEADYNQRLAATAPELLNLDAKIKRPGGAATGIEFCDILTTDNEILHVKRKSRSSTLSHLFAQGRVSATTLLTDGHFRDEVRTVIEQQAGAGAAAWLPSVPPSGAQISGTGYMVSYVIITDSTKPAPDWLPFFSKLNLMQTGRELTRMGFGVSLTRVAVS